MATKIGSIPTPIAAAYFSALVAGVVRIASISRSRCVDQGKQNDRYECYHQVAFDECHADGLVLMG